MPVKVPASLRETSDSPAIGGELTVESHRLRFAHAAGETEIRYRRNGDAVVERTTSPTRRLHDLTAAALERGEELEGLEVRRPTLEDVYLELTAE